MTWIDLLRERLWRTISRLPFASSKREAILDDELARCVADTENGRPFGAPPREGDSDWTPAMAGPRAPVDDEESVAAVRKPDSGSWDKQRADILEKWAAEKLAQESLTSRGERFSDLRKRAHKEWEEQ